MPTVNQLLRVHENSKLLFGYDNAGNQNQRFYCAVQGCSLPTTSASRPADKNIASNEDIVSVEELNNIAEPLKITLSPNPTEGFVLLRLNPNSELLLSHNINIYSNNGVLVKSVESFSKTELQIDLSNLSSGLYLIHMHFNNGTTLTKQIIKN